MRFKLASPIHLRMRDFPRAVITLKFLFMLSATIVTAAAMVASPAQQPVQQPVQVDEPVAAGVLLETRCANVQPDAEYFIPENISAHTVPSGSGGYGYRQGCPFWVVDFSMNSKSNTVLSPDGSRFREPTLFYGIAHDLPSSQSAGGKDPIVKEDCLRLRVEYIIYTKFKHESAFVIKRHITAKGTWISSANVCSLSLNYALPENSFKTEAPEANVRVIRVATRVKLRTSWQEAAGRVEDAPVR